MRRLWVVGESMPLKKDGKERMARASANLPGRLVPMDPRHGVFPNLVMKPLFAAVFSAFKNRKDELEPMLAEMADVVKDDSDRRFNVFIPRITDQEENPDDLFLIAEQEMTTRIERFRLEQDLWLVFGHQTNFGLLKWLLEGRVAKSNTRTQLKEYSTSFVNQVFELCPDFTKEQPTSKSGRVGFLHRLCVEGSETNGDSRRTLQTVINRLKPKAGRSTEWIVEFLRSTVPLLHNEAYQDAGHPTGNAQAHFVRSAVKHIGPFDLYWQVMGNAIAKRLVNENVE